MASAYATLAAGGIYSEPTAIRKVVLPSGEDTNAGWGKPKRRRVISDGVAYEVTRDPRGEHPVRDGHRRRLRAARGREDGHDRGALRRLVLRLHAAARDDRLGRLPAGEDLRWRTCTGSPSPAARFPARHLAAVHELGDRPARLGRVPRADATGRSGRRSSAAPSGARSATTAIDDIAPTTTADDDAARPTTPTGSPRRSRRPRRRRRRPRRRRRRRRAAPPPPPPPPPDTASRAAARVDRALIRLGARARLRRRAIALLVAGCVACAWIAGAPLVPSDAGRAGSPGPRRASSSRCSWRRSSLSRRAAPAAAPDLARRAVLVLAVAIQLLPLAAPLLLSTDAWTYWEYGRIAAVHDGESRTSTRRASSPATRRTSTPAQPGGRRRPSTGPRSRSSRRASRSSRARRPPPRRGSSRCSRRLAVLACALLAARLARDRPFALAFVGWNPLLAIHFAGGGHNDALMMALVARRARARRAAGRQGLAGAAWAASIFVKWVPAVFFALRTVEARASGRRVGHARLRGWRRSRLAASRRCATASTGLRAFGPLARNAEGQTSYALPHRLEQLGVPHALALAARGRRRWRPALPGSRARRARGRTRSGWPAACCSRRRPA